MSRLVFVIILILLQFQLFLIPRQLKAYPINQRQQQKRIALVIGNGNYTASVLSNPENDARSMKIAFQSLGFTVYEYENLNQSQMKKAIDDFGLKLKGFDVGLFYYAGHGIQSNGYNYLIPVDAQLMTERQVEYDCVQADRILALMEGSGTSVNIIILDACRNNPFERSWTRSSTGRGLAFMNAPSGTLIAYSTAPGNTALDGSGNNSPYTSAILESLNIPGRSIAQMFQNVTRIVSQKTAKQQIPWISSSLTSDFYFDKIDNMISDNQKNIIESEKKQLINGNLNIKNKTENKVNSNLLRFDQYLIAYIDGVQTSNKEARNYMKENDFESYKIYNRKSTARITCGLIGLTGTLVCLVSGSALMADVTDAKWVKITAGTSLTTTVLGLATGLSLLSIEKKWLVNYNVASISYLELRPTENGFGLVFNF